MDIYDLFYELEGLSNLHTQAVLNAKKGFEDFLAFIKTFDENEFGDIYTEREWRSIKPFGFEYDNVAMIVLPRSLDNGDHYERFVETDARTLNLPRTVPVVAWEDLVEH